MSFRTRLISALVVIALLAGLIGISIYGTGNAGSTSESLFASRETLHFWYTDDALSDYLNDVIVAYNEQGGDYRVEPELITDTDYIMKINDQSVAGTDYPDLFLAGNNELERLYKGGLAAIVHDEEHFVEQKLFPQTAIDAVTFEGQTVAYPFSFETSAFLYNRDLLRSMEEAAEEAQDSEAEAGEGEDAAQEAADSADTSDTVQEEDTAQTVASAAETAEAEAAAEEDGDAGTRSDGGLTVPSTLTELINLSNDYDAPADLNAILKWDVSDIFFNYGFVGNYIDVGGPAGDDPDQLDLYNEKAIQSLQVYQQLNQYFSIDTRSDDYDSVMQDFMDGKIIFTFATTDAVKKISDAVSNGESTVDYGVVRMPDATEELKSRAVSMTDCVVVNAYGEHQEAVNDFIQYMLYHHTDDFFARTGKGLAQAGYAYSDHHMNGFYEAYVDSVPMTKLREAANFWVLLENTMANVWDGADANTALYELTQQVMVQITGTENYKVEKLPDPPEISIRSELSGGD